MSGDRRVSEYVPLCVGTGEWKRLLTVDVGAEKVRLGRDVGHGVVLVPASISIK